MPASESDRREFPRLRCKLLIRYKMLSTAVQDPGMDQVFEGTTTNLSMGGLLLTGPIPNLDWVKDLLLGRINVGLNFLLPGQEVPAKALAKISWLEAKDEEAMSFRIGLRIVDMPADHRRTLSEFLMQQSEIP